MKYQENQTVIKLVMTTFVLLSVHLANATEDSMYMCLDAIEGAESFEIHSNRATYMRDEFKITTFEGRQMTWGEIDQELTDAGYKGYVIHLNPSPEDEAKFKARREKALENPRIAQLATKWETEYNSREASEKRYKEHDVLLSKTYTFHRSRSGAKMLEGIEGFDQREDSLSPVRPYGLLATRSKTDGQYLYVLTKEGVRRKKVADSKETGNQRYVVGLKRIDDRTSLRKSEYPKVDVVALDDSSVRSKWPNDKELGTSGLEGHEVFDNTSKYVEKLGAKFVEIDYSKYPLSLEISKDAKTVFQKDLADIIEHVVSVHKNQMSYLSKIDDAQKARIAEDWKKDDRWLSEFYTDRYTTALQKCADLNFGITSEAIDAITKIRENQRQFFPSQQVEGGQGGIQKPTITNSICWLPIHVPFRQKCPEEVR